MESGPLAPYGARSAELGAADRERHVDDRGWIDQASCRGADPDAFFVRGTVNVRGALRLCQGCPVQEPCLEYALEEEIDFGVWGGLTERQRRSLQRRRLAPTG
jgi:WhiB family transcriptional regulator, redox-sensing transcriptional regulator